MRDIGNRHVQPRAAIVHGLTEHRVIKVLGIFTVNGDKRQFAQINTMGQIGFGHFFGQALHRALNIGRPLKGNAMASQGDINFHARRHVVAQNLGDRAHSLAAVISVAADFRHHKLAVLRLANVFFRNQDFLADAPVIRDHQAKTALVVETPDHLRGAALQHLNNHALTAATAIHARHPRQHDITVKYLDHLAWAEEQIPRAILRDKKAHAFLVTLDAALDQLHLVRQAINATAVADQLAITGHGDQAPAQGLQLILIIGQLQVLTQVLITHRLADFLHVFHDEFAAGDGFFVVLGFAVGEGVFDGGIACGLLLGRPAGLSVLLLS